MILEVIIQSVFSGVGSTLLKEWMRQAKKKDDAELQRLIQEGIDAYLHRSASSPIMINEAVITEIVRRLKAGEVTLQFGREIVEEQLKRARRRKREMEEIISQARTIQYSSLDTPTILRKGQESGGARYEELSREQKEIAGIPDIYVRERLEAARQRESSINEQTTDIVKLHRQALLSGRGMSGEEFLDHWRAILIVYQQRLDVLNGRIRELETVQANSLTTVSGIIEEQLKRARRRKSEIEEIIGRARTIQYGSSDTPTILRKGQKSGGTRYEELSRERTEIAGISDTDVRERLETVRQRESSINEQTTDIVKHHREALLSGPMMSREEFLEHWRAILKVYQQRLDVLNARIRELEAVHTR